VTHQTCRQDARADCQSLCELNGACDGYDTYRQNVDDNRPNPASLPQCVSDGHLADDYIKADDSRLGEMEACLEKMKVWLDGLYPDDPNDSTGGLYPRYEECDRVSNGCEDNVAACDGKQGEFQAARCLFAMESNLRCEAFQRCYTEERDTCGWDCGNISIRAAARTADIETGQRLVCLLHTLFGKRDPSNSTGTGFLARPSDEQRPQLLEECKSKEFDEVAEWSIPCPADSSGLLPSATPTIEGYECPEDDVTSPCSSAFEDDMSSMWPSVVPGIQFADPKCSQIAQRGVQMTSLSCAAAGPCIADRREMYLIVAGGPAFHSSDGCKNVVTWGPSLDITSNHNQPESLASSPDVKAAGCRCCGEEASSQCAGKPCSTLTFTECSEACAVAGGRLCTQAEVLNGEVQQTGCMYVTMHVWPSTVGQPAQVQTAMAAL